MIETRRACRADASTVHDCLVNVEAWPLWSPHVAAVRPGTGRVEEGWSGSVRAFFSPAPTTMRVTLVRPDGGYDWESRVGPWRLAYENHVDAVDGGGCQLVFRAGLDGPAATQLERLVAPLSALGQRRRMDRLARLAELIEARTAD